MVHVSVVFRAKVKTDKRSFWIIDKQQRLATAKACVAVANENVRIIWSLTAREHEYWRASIWPTSCPDSLKRPSTASPVSLPQLGQQKHGTEDFSYSHRNAVNRVFRRAHTHNLRGVAWTCPTRGSSSRAFVPSNASGNTRDARLRSSS